MNLKRLQIDLAVGLFVLYLMVPVAGAFDSNDLAGDWWLHGLISGDCSNPGENPGWFWMSLEFDADGNGTATSTVHDSLGNMHYQPTLERFALNRFGRFTSERIGNFCGAMHIDRDLMVALATMAPGAYEDVRGYNLQIYSRAGSGFTAADLAGTWWMHHLNSGDAPAWTGWSRGILQVDNLGEFSFAPGSYLNSDGEADAPAGGTIGIGSDGRLTVSMDPSSHGVLHRGKHLGVLTMHDEGGYNLSILQKRSGVEFSAADLTGIWHLHGLTAGDAPQWTGWFRGHMEVRASGAVAMSVAKSDGTVGRKTGTVQVSKEGVVTLVEDPSAHGVMSDDKNLVVLTMDDGGGGYNLVILGRAAETFSTHDYGVGTPQEYGIKTFEWTYGGTGEWTSEIIGTTTVDYGNGSLTGVEITNVVDVPAGLWSEVMQSDGSIIRALALGDFYLSSDEFLTSHPDVWSFGTVTDGMLLDMRPYYLIRSDSGQSFKQENGMLLYRVQDANVLHGYYTDALNSWTIDASHPFVDIDLLGRDATLGLAVPTELDTGGYAVTGFRLRARDIGVIALGRVDPLTGQLLRLGELREIADVPASADPFMGSRVLRLFGDSNISDGVQLDWHDAALTASRGPGTGYTLTTADGGLSLSMSRSGNQLSLNPRPQGTTVNSYMFSDGVNGAFVLMGQEILDPLDISIRVATWTGDSPFSASDLVGDWEMIWLQDTNLGNDPSEAFDMEMRTVSIADVGGGQIEADIGYATWTMQINGNVLEPLPGALEPHIAHLSVMTDGHALIIAILGVEPYDPTDVSATIGFSTRDGHVLSCDMNWDGIVSIIGDVPAFVRVAYFNDYPWYTLEFPGKEWIGPGDCNHDGILSILGDVPCFVDCVYFGNCLE